MHTTSSQLAVWRASSSSAFWYQLGIATDQPEPPYGAARLPLALRDIGPAAAPSLDALTARLKDEDANVRMMAAQAIGRQGAAAFPAVDPLLDACRHKDEHVHVLRSLATALGQIGPAASRALPALRDLARIPRVQWAAEEAIGKIEKRRQ